MRPRFLLNYHSGVLLLQSGAILSASLFGIREVTQIILCLKKLLDPEQHELKSGKELLQAVLVRGTSRKQTARFHVAASEYNLITIAWQSMR